MWYADSMRLSLSVAYQRISTKNGTEGKGEDACISVENKIWNLKEMYGTGKHYINYNNLVPESQILSSPSYVSP